MKREDITPGYYWMRDGDNLVVVEVVAHPALGILAVARFGHGEQDILDASAFVGRVADPGDVDDATMAAYADVCTRAAEVWCNQGLSDGDSLEVRVAIRSFVSQFAFKARMSV